MTICSPSHSKSWKNKLEGPTGRIFRGYVGFSGETFAETKQKKKTMVSSRNELAFFKKNK